MNRIAEKFLDQLQLSGHAERDDDLKRFAALGVRTLRYPILWERIAPHGLEHADWSWADARLQRLRELGIRPIVGLVHHGSGPRQTHLLDPAFPEKLAAFARAVAERYPWLDAYTPVNEPLTTARFSGLYGLWYPHASDEHSFTSALLNQCRAIVLAMAEIRAVNPRAQLVQTEDLGQTHSTPELAYQAEHENHRRWLTFDLLCGRVNAKHPLWDYFPWAGQDERTLEFFLERPCPPDLLGINHYVTSERYLDERLEFFPPHTHGGNGQQVYADVEAVRVRGVQPTGLRALLYETWKRYQLPLAVTEAHIGCTREEQLRWLWHVWQSAHAAQRAGADVRAVTAWALLGTYNWNVLVTCDAGDYESGVFDVRAPEPRATALAHMVSALAKGRRYDHPVLAVPGWWQRAERVFYALPAPRAEKWRDVMPHRSMSRRTNAQPLLISGASGTLGRAFARMCEQRALPFRLLSRRELDIADAHSVARALDAIQPWALINAAGYVRVDDAEHERARCFRENAHGPALLAEACAQRGVQLLTFSSDLVFDGSSNAPYVESDAVAPLNVYGQSKADAERAVLARCPAALVVRTSAFFGPWDEHNFVTHVLRALRAGHVFSAADDVTVSPTYVPDLVQTCLDLLIDSERGIWHLANHGAVTWAELARQAAARAGLDSALVHGRPSWAMGWAAARPRYSVLGSERGWLLPALEDALDRYAEQARDHDALQSCAAAPLARAA